MNESKKNDTIEFLRMGWKLTINDIELSHRFRTSFTNNDGENFFIEIGISDINQYMPAHHDNFSIGDKAFRLDHIFRKEYISSNVDPLYARLERGFIQIATKENIINFINKTFNCSFLDLKVVENLTINYENNTVSKKDSKAKDIELYFKNNGFEEIEETEELTKDRIKLEKNCYQIFITRDFSNIRYGSSTGIINLDGENGKGFIQMNPDDFGEVTEIINELEEVLQTPKKDLIK